MQTCVSKFRIFRNPAALIIPRFFLREEAAAAPHYLAAVSGDSPKSDYSRLTGFALFREELGKPLLREWRARENILRRHRRDSGLTVSIEGGWTGTGYAIFIIRRIREPEDHVVQ